MKKIFRIFLVMLLTSGAMAAKANTYPPSDSARDEARAAQMLIRLNEIQSMDKSSLSPAEKKDLKKELTKMKKEADGLNKKVTISVAAIIIIILLLILIL